MTTRNSSVLAMAAALALGGAAYCTAQQENAQIRQEQQQQQHQQNENQQQGGQRELSQLRQQDRQVQQQVMQQLQQIRQQGGQEAADKLFILNQCLGNEEEIVLSQQVAEKSQNPQVKQIAEKMIQDHSQMSRQLQQVAQQLQMQAPEGLTPMKLEEIEIMTSLPSDQLDQHYVAKMNEMHAKDVACFRAACKLAQNQQVKQFATQTLPTIQQHHHEIMQTAMQMGITGPGAEEAQPAGTEIRGSEHQRGQSEQSGQSGQSEKPDQQQQQQK